MTDTKHMNAEQFESHMRAKRGLPEPKPVEPEPAVFRSRARWRWEHNVVTSAPDTNAQRVVGDCGNSVRLESIELRKAGPSGYAIVVEPRKGDLRSPAMLQREVTAFMRNKLEPGTAIEVSVALERDGDPAIVTWWREGEPFPEPGAFGTLQTVLSCVAACPGVVALAVEETLGNVRLRVTFSRASWETTTHDTRKAVIDRALDESVAVGVTRHFTMHRQGDTDADI